MITQPDGYVDHSLPVLDEMLQYVTQDGITIARHPNITAPQQPAKLT